MSTSDLLSSTLNWPGQGVYGLKSSVLQTTENDLVKQAIVSDHMRHHYRRLHGARSAVDSKPPKSMILGQKCRDRARKEMAQLAYTQSILGQYSGGSTRNTPRGRSSQSARSGRFAQSQPTTYRARSRSTDSARMVTRSLTMNGSTQNLNKNDPNGGDIANKLFGDGVLTQALTSMAALGKITSSERNKSSADVLDKHPDFFSQPHPSEHQPRLVKRDGTSSLRNNRAYYNPPTKTKSRPTKQQPKTEEIIPDENKQKEDEQLALREQLNKSLELRHNVEKKIKKAQTTTTATNPPIRKQSDEALKQFGLTERERLQYVRFMQEITDAIIRNNLTTEPAIEKLFEIHIDRNRGTLDERRLRALLEALKQDLGVQSSRKPDTYASVHKATSYDNEPLPPQAPVTTREDSLILTPKTRYDDRRNTDYDVNAPLPWQSDNDLDKQPKITHEIKQNNLNTNKQNPLNDDYLFSPISTTATTTTTTIKPKPRLSLQTKTEAHYQSDDIPNTITTEHESTIPMNFNSTIRKPVPDIHNVDWLTDSQPTKTTTEKRSLHHVEEHNIEEEVDDDEPPSPSPRLSHHRHHVEEHNAAEEVDDDEPRSPSPRFSHHRETNAYGNDFDENENETDNTEQ